MPGRRRRSPSSSSSSTKRRKKKDKKRRKRKSESCSSRSDRSKKSGDSKPAKSSKASKRSKSPKKSRTEKQAKSEKQRKRSRSKSAKKGKSRSRSRSTKKVSAVQPAEKKTEKKDVPDWLADLLPQAGGSSAPLATQTAVRTEQVELPLSMIGLLTAGNEAVVRNIASTSGAVVQLRQDMSHFGYCLVFITGTAEKVAQAKEMLHQQVGLSGSLVTKDIDTAADHISAHNALELAMSEMHKRKSHLSASVVMPNTTDGRVKIRIGPGQIALVSMAEQLIRKQLCNVELEILYKSGRPVPIEMKVAKLCQFFEQGGCVLGARCQCCHGPEELSLAKKARVLQNPGAEIARGLDTADVPRWPPLPGDIRALAPMVEGQDPGTTPWMDVVEADRTVQMKSETSGLI